MTVTHAFLGKARYDSNTKALVVDVNYPSEDSPTPVPLSLTCSRLWSGSHSDYSTVLQNRLVKCFVTQKKVTEIQWLDSRFRTDHWLKGKLNVSPGWSRLGTGILLDIDNVIFVPIRGNDTPAGIAPQANATVSCKITSEGFLSGIQSAVNEQFSDAQQQDNSPRWLPGKIVSATNGRSKQYMIYCDQTKTFCKVAAHIATQECLEKSVGQQVWVIPDENGAVEQFLAKFSFLADGAVRHGHAQFPPVSHTGHLVWRHTRTYVVYTVVEEDGKTFQISAKEIERFKTRSHLSNAVQDHYSTFPKVRFLCARDASGVQHAAHIQLAQSAGSPSVAHCYSLIGQLTPASQRRCGAVGGACFTVLLSMNQRTPQQLAAETSGSQMPTFANPPGLMQHYRLSPEALGSFAHPRTNLMSWVTVDVQGGQYSVQTLICPTERALIDRVRAAAVF